jgi:hypothetical protein
LTTYMFDQTPSSIPSLAAPCTCHSTSIIVA